MQRKAKTGLGIVAALVALGGVVSLFEGGADRATADNAKPSVTASASVAEPGVEPGKGAGVEPSEEVSGDTSGIPVLDPAQREVLLRALRAIEPELAADGDAAVDQGPGRVPGSAWREGRRHRSDQRQIPVRGRYGPAPHRRPGREHRDRRTVVVLRLIEAARRTPPGVTCLEFPIFRSSK